MVPPSNGHQRRPPCKQHSKLSNPADHRREPTSLPGRWRWCDRPRLCDAQKASALHTLIRQRHPTPSCGGHAPTAERTMNPARMCLESLDHRPGIREQPGPIATLPRLLKRVGYRSEADIAGDVGGLPQDWTSKDRGTIHSQFLKSSANGSRFRSRRLRRLGRCLGKGLLVQRLLRHPALATDSPHSADETSSAS